MSAFLSSLWRYGLQEDQLFTRVKVCYLLVVNNLLDCSFDCVSKQEFYNEPLNETIEMDRDFAYWKMPDQVSLNHIWSLREPL